MQITKELEELANEICKELLLFYEYNQYFNIQEQVAILAWCFHKARLDLRYTEKDLKTLVFLFKKYKDADLNIVDACQFSIENNYNYFMPIVLHKKGEID